MTLIALSMKVLQESETLLGLSVPPMEKYLSSRAIAALRSAKAASSNVKCRISEASPATEMEYEPYKVPDPKSVKIAALVPSLAFNVAASVETS